MRIGIDYTAAVRQKAGIGRYARSLVRALSAPGMWVQKITTKQPSDDMIEVAIVSMEQALAADGEEPPPGGIAIEREPLLLAGAPSTPAAGG